MFDGFSEETVPGDGTNIFVRHASHRNGARPGTAKSGTDPTSEVAHSATDPNRPANGYGILLQVFFKAKRATKTGSTLKFCAFLQNEPESIPAPG